MEVSVEEGSNLERRLQVRIPEDRVSGEVERRLTDMAGSVRLPGFRPGKAPLKVVAQRFGRQVRQEVVGEIIQSSFYEALVKEKLRPAGTPRIDPVESEPGRGIAYTAIFDVYPDVAIPPVESLEIRRPAASVSEADVDGMIETLRRQRRNWKAVERAATAEDRVVIDFDGSIDGEPIERGSGTEVPVELSGGRMIPGFEEALVGTSAGEEKEFDLTFPGDYPAQDVAGKSARFRVKVHRVEEPELPAVDDAFARAYGVADGGIDTLRAEVRDNMQRELDEAVRVTLKRRVMDSLLHGRDLELPRSMVEDEIRRTVAQRRVELAHSGVDPDTVEIDPGAFEEQARMRVSLGLLLAELIKANGIEPDKDRVRARIEGIASTYEQPEEVINWYYRNKERLADVESTVLEDQVVDWILERAKVTDEPSSFDALLKPGQT